MIGLRNRRVLDDRGEAVRNRRLGIVGVFAIVVALVTTGLAYVNPAGQASYTAHSATSGGVRVGDEVRVAGVPVGKVTGVRLSRTLVEVTFDADRSVSIGNDSTLDIRLLTPLGGHYVALDPQGNVPLGRNIIPPQRVKTPFEGNDIIQAVTPFLRDVNGQVIHDTFTELANATNKYPNALREILQSANELTGSLSKMSGDFHRGLDFVNDASSAFTSGRQQLTALIEQFALVGQRYTSKSVDIVEFFTLLGELTRIIDRVMVFYNRELAPSVNGIDDIVTALVAHPERVGKASEGLTQIVNVLLPMLQGHGVVVDQSNRVVHAPAVCLPNMVKQC
ncbi:MAG: MCE family protein [Mycobacterium sp.]|jgi:phospholipid/cholesterol/gamma-HCH transport system substrate-binding protein|uniref:Mammalian cell entry protein n=1 Tax=Mycobacterium gordonae TaxID=1778 RepID=A0A1A6BN68_MYCGO|nr:MlaD family protein [Mycobacterium gordonae]MBI2702226.1 MCE family protein [Mycobacterium sp.]OBS03802.1 mammalian cell entry protein [Mycobacterium gordonae]PJE16318.1 MAG: MCE family protein [Mycobacterium sp.]